MSVEQTGELPDMEQLVHAFCVLDAACDVRAFLADLCTPREIAELAQRLQVARKLDAGESYLGVQASTGASSTTVSRVSKALNGARGGYRGLLAKLEGGA